MPDPIYTSHQGLINLANRECGYKAVWVENGARGRWSNKGNLVIEHTNGSEETCRNGRVIGRQGPSYPSYPSHPDRYQPRPQPQRGIDATDAAIIGILGGVLIGSALSDH